MICGRVVESDSSVVFWEALTATISTTSAWIHLIFVVREPEPKLAALDGPARPFLVVF